MEDYILYLPLFYNLFVISNYLMIDSVISLKSEIILSVLYTLHSVKLSKEAALFMFYFNFSDSFLVICLFFPSEIQSINCEWELFKLMLQVPLE